MAQQCYSLVAGIDFGTTFSGFAFSSRREFEKDPLKVSSASWTAVSGAAISLKTPTCILFRPNGQFDSFGYEAEDRYSELALDQEHHGWFFFKRFKMMLHDSKGMHRTMKLKDVEGKEMLAVDVFAEAISFLKDELLKACADKMIDAEDDSVKWVLTVPAIWDDSAKQFMRESAQKAGIPGKRLALALEPEAASMYCRYLPMERMTGSSTKAITCFQPSSKYLVLDAGGGTVDITVHEVIQSGKLKELFKASGGNWGGTTIDQAFLDFICNITGSKVMAKFRLEHEEDYMDLMREFEVKKRNIRPDMEGKVTFKVPLALHEVYRDETGREIRDALKENPETRGKITLAGDKMRIDSTLVQSFFDSCSQRIIEHLKGIFREPSTQGTDTILMVGGFAESPMLQNAVQTAFADKRVIIPHEPGLAVLKGAVIFGHNSDVITSRISKYTYGLKVYAPFDPSIHPKNRMMLNRHGEKTVRGSFDKLLEAGQPIIADCPSAKKTYGPHEGSGSFCIKLFATPSANPVFVDDPDCFSIGEVDVDCVDRYGKVGTAEVSLHFGGAELEVRATLNSTGDQTTAVFNILE